MQEKTTAQVVAENLKAFMEEKKVTQAELAKKASMGQSTVSLYLRPEARLEGAKGKVAGPNLAHIESLARALGKEPWELLKPTDSLRAIAIERAIGLLQAMESMPPYKLPPRPDLDAGNLNAA